MHGRPAWTAALLATASLAGGLLAGVSSAAAAAGPETIFTVAGGPGRGLATNVFQEPQAVTASPGRNVYVADGYVVRRLDTNSNWEGVTAGQGVPGFGGDGGPAVSALLGGVGALTVDHAGNLVILDSDNNRVRVVAARSGRFYGQAMTARRIYTVAGDGTFGFSGDGGPATKAGLSFPEGVAVDPAGNLVIADTDAHRVRVVAARSGRFYGQAMTSGNIYTVAGNGSSGDTGDGGPARDAELGFLQAVTVDGAGNLVLSDSVNGVIRVVAAQSGTFYGQAMTAGDIYTVAGNGSLGYAGDGGPATKAELNFPDGVAVDQDGNLAIADSGNNRVRLVAAQSGTFYGQAMTVGDIYTVAGDGSSGLAGNTGPATAAALNFPEGVTFDSAGNLVIADNANHRVRVVAAQSGTFYGRAMTAGHIYIAAGNTVPGSSGNRGLARNAVLYVPDSGPTESAVTADGGNDLVAQSGQVWFICRISGTYFGRLLTAGHIYQVAGDGFAGYSGDGGPGQVAQVWAPRGLAIDRAGNLIIADTNNNRVRVVAGQSGTFYGRAMTAGHIYTVAGTGTVGFSGDGGPATAAKLFTPEAVAVDRSGNLVIGDAGNGRVRVVAARTGTFYGQAMTAGDIYTVAGDGDQRSSGDGGPATAAGLTPGAIAIDGAGNLVIADSYPNIDISNNRIRVVAARTGTFYGQAMTAGDIYTVAGTGDAGYSGDGGPATAAELDNPDGVAVDQAGNLVIGDTYNNVIRVVAARTGTFYGQAMTAEDIYTVAGDGTDGYAGDGGPATAAELSSPQGVAVGQSGDLVIGDGGNGRVRIVRS
jgi:secreted PhoX family phosphatase